MKTMQSGLAIVMVASTFLVAGQSQADIVTNGGFETGNFTGWTQFGNTGFTQVSFAAAHSGSFGALFSPLGSTGGITQLLATTPGQPYQFSFWLANTGGGTNSFLAQWDGGTLASGTNVGSFPFTLFSFPVLATGASTPITFTFRNDPQFFFLDDVSVIPTGPATPAPEPSTIVMFGISALALAFDAARRRLRKPC